MTDLPVAYEWTGDVMRPRGPRALLQCDRQYLKGQTVWLSEEHSRSAESHNHLFAWLHDAWLNLPEDIADEYPSPEALRKRTLIQAGYYDETVVDADTPEAALRVAAGVRAYASHNDLFTMVFVRDNFVFIRSPQSQSYRAMGKEKFQESKQAILEIISGMIGVTTTELEAKGSS